VDYFALFVRHMMFWHLYLGHAGAWMTLLVLNSIFRGVKLLIFDGVVLSLLFGLFSAMAHYYLFLGH
jgi:hypothetical protein